MNTEFSNILKQNESQVYLDQLRNFIAKYAHQIKNQSWSIQRQTYFNFYNEILEISSQDISFTSFTKTFQVDGLKEAWEKLILTKIHHFVFAVPGSDDFKLDFILDHKAKLHVWIEERHLDLSFKFNEDIVDIYSQEIIRMNEYRAPKDKLIILQNSMQILTNFIESQGETNAGNDNLLPLLILAIIRANPPKLMSNIKYIRRFRQPSKLEIGAVSFYLTNMISAISFICNLKLGELTITEEEKSFRIEQMKVIKEHLSQERKAAAAIANSTVHSNKSPGLAFGEMASKAFQSTSIFFGKMMDEVKKAGESAAEKIDHALNSEPSSPLSTTSSPHSQQNKFSRPTVDPLFPVTSSNEDRQNSRMNSSSVSSTHTDQDLSASERNLIYDYELQLGMALSLSMVEQIGSQQTNDTNDNSGGHDMINDKSSVSMIMNENELVTTANDDVDGDEKKTL